jgi:uncharacterized protein YodC (DUF2158 family)
MAYFPKEKVGKTVILKGGGPYMTIASFTDASEKVVTCIWFNKNNDIVNGTFNIDCLKFKKEE